MMGGKGGGREERGVGRERGEMMGGGGERKER